ncbi:recombinase family protein [Actinomadura sp. ATCC 39365]
MTQPLTSWILYAYSAADDVRATDRQLAEMRGWVADRGGEIVEECFDLCGRGQLQAVLTRAADDGAGVLVVDRARLGRYGPDLDQVHQAVKAGTVIHVLREGRPVTLEDSPLGVMPAHDPAPAEAARRERRQLLAEARAQRAKAQRFCDERAERVRRLEQDLGIVVRPFRCPCVLRHPDRPEPEGFGHCTCPIDFGHLHDHGMSWWRGGTMFAAVVEPYEVCGESVAVLTESCRPFDLRVQVSGQHAVHCPPYTLAVVVLRGEDTLPDRERPAAVG